MTLPGWTREPLVHFLVAGALLYAFFAWSGGNAVDPSSRVIEVGREEQAQLAVQFERTMGRSPTDAELDAQIEKFVRDEVLYREALRLGLDQGDAVVRRRMVSKMDMTASAAAEVAEPTVKQLKAYFKENAARYGNEVKVSFDQHYFDAQDEAIEALRNDSPGQAISLPAEMEEASLREIGDRFGTDFANTLSELEPGSRWQGPVRSGFGWHLVRVTDRSAGAPDFDSLRPRIENDWRSAQIETRKDRAFAILRDAYRVEIDR
ncbi:peptidyl-prolyl cis-trans isomerase [Erythrobacter sp. THAF29]|uniref:peptidylprolyl isomerase n=1 Tax=Erythrobacter sp. THAF29 TaxID=2587851 RepID=UPI001268FC6E|nr:peptidylprolyl isomerase [Erythrobacter sp. THAF29]QFT75957.1 hypothetical protein FIU90_00240 [Erythrobacter sp. THAF29]